jgi:hypothetical protein
MRPCLTLTRAADRRWPLGQGRVTISHDPIEYPDWDTLWQKFPSLELRNDQGRFGLLGGGNGSRELRPIRALPAFDFAEVRGQLAVVAGNMPHDRVALGLEAKAAPASGDQWKPGSKRQIDWTCPAPVTRKRTFACYTSATVCQCCSATAPYVLFHGLSE